MDFLLLLVSLAAVMLNLFFEAFVVGYILRTYVSPHFELQIPMQALFGLVVLRHLFFPEHRAGGIEIQGKEVVWKIGSRFFDPIILFFAAWIGTFFF